MHLSLRTQSRVAVWVRRCAIVFEIASAASLWVWWHGQQRWTTTAAVCALAAVSALCWGLWFVVTPARALERGLHRMGLQCTDREGRVRRATVAKVCHVTAGETLVYWRLPLGMTPADMEQHLDAVRHHWDCEVSMWRERKYVVTRLRDQPIPEEVSGDEFMVFQPPPEHRVPVAVGVAHRGPLWLDLENAVHLLVAGLPGSGKSVWLRQMLTRMAFDTDPARLQIIAIDLKRGMDFRFLRGSPHLCGRVVTTAEEAAAALNWVVATLQARLDAMHEAGASDLTELQRSSPVDASGRHPRLVVVCDELAELTTAEYGDDKAARARQRAAVADLSTIARLGRVAGVHLVVCTQRPDADVVPGQLKANLSTTVAFRVRSKLNSRIVLDGDAAADLPPIPGRGVLVHDETEEFQGPYLSNDRAALLLGARWGDRQATDFVTPWPQSPVRDAA